MATSQLDPSPTPSSNKETSRIATVSSQLILSVGLCIFALLLTIIYVSVLTFSSNGMRVDKHNACCKYVTTFSTIGSVLGFAASTNAGYHLLFRIHRYHVNSFAALFLSTSGWLCSSVFHILSLVHMSHGISTGGEHGAHRVVASMLTLVLSLACSLLTSVLCLHVYRRQQWFTTASDTSPSI